MVQSSLNTRIDPRANVLEQPRGWVEYLSNLGRKPRSEEIFLSFFFFAGVGNADLNADGQTSYLVMFQNRTANKDTIRLFSGYQDAIYILFGDKEGIKNSNRFMNWTGLWKADSDTLIGGGGEGGGVY